jgi:hypothetical protein
LTLEVRRRAQNNQVCADAYGNERERRRKAAQKPLRVQNLDAERFDIRRSVVIVEVPYFLARASTWVVIAILTPRARRRRAGSPRCRVDAVLRNPKVRLAVVEQRVTSDPGHRAGDERGTAIMRME